MYLKRQAFLVLGLSKSGRAASEFLLAERAVTYVYDDIDSERVEQTISALEQKGARRVKKEDLPRVDRKNVV